MFFLLRSWMMVVVGASMVAGPKLPHPSTLVAHVAAAQTELPHLPASLEGSIRTVGTPYADIITINFYNNTGNTIYSYWLDGNGNRAQQETMKPGDVGGYYTSVGTPFLVTDSSGNGLFIVMATTPGAYRATAGTQNNDFKLFSSSATAAPSINAGDVANIDASFTNLGPGYSNVLTDIKITSVDSGGNRTVVQESPVQRSIGWAETFSQSISTSASLAPGFYYVSLSVSNAAGSQIFYSNDYATGFYVYGLNPSKSCGNPDDTPGQPSVGEPINIATGNVYDEKVDYESGGSYKLRFSRFYNSLSSSTLAVDMGGHWRTNFDSYIYKSSASSMSLEGADGRTVQFYNTGSKWISDSDVNMQLAKSGANWILTSLNGSVETYEPTTDKTRFRLHSRATRSGYTQILSYTSNQLTGVTDSFNKKILLTYSGNLISSVATPDGMKLTYGYDSSGENGATLDRLRSVSYSTQPASQIRYVYEAAGLPYCVTGVLDENGSRYMSWTYDALGRGLSSQLGTGSQLTTIFYSDSDGSRHITYPLGGSETYHFTAQQGVPKVTKIDQYNPTTGAFNYVYYSYDSNGYLAGKSDWNGNPTFYINDGLGRQVQVTEASGGTQRITLISYYGNTDLPSLITKPRQTIAFSYDVKGNLLTRTVTDKSTQSIPYSTKGQTRTWTFTWSNGLLASEKGPRTDTNQITKYSYDASGTLTTTTNALGQTTKITSHTPGGLPNTSVDANGLITQYSYDVRGRLTALNESGRVRSYGYDPAGNRIQETMPDGSTKFFDYDTAHRLIAERNSLGEKKQFDYDANDDLFLTKILDASGAPQSQRGESYDSLGRKISTTGGAGQLSKRTLDSNGNARSTTDALGRVSYHAYDALNRPIRDLDPNGNSVFTTYNDADQPLKVVAQNGATTTYVYDGFGDVIQVQSPDSGTSIYRYDEAGNLIQKTDAAGVVTNNAYDALNRLVTTAYPADSRYNFSITYDEPGHGYGVGQITTVHDLPGTLSRSYDFRGSVLSETRTTFLGDLTTTYSYDRAGRVSTIGYPSGVVIQYFRDALGRTSLVRSVKSGVTKTIVSGLTYKPFGPVSALSFGNSLNETRSFDGDYRLTKVSDIGKFQAQSLSYAYDGNDNVKGLTDGVTPGQSQAFTYDKLNQLTGATGVYGVFSYGYDKGGNRTTLVGANETDYSYQAASNRLSSIAAGGATQNLTYLANGNIVSDGKGLTFSYGINQRLAYVSNGTNQIGSYAYDAFGHRLFKGNKEFTYDLTGRLIEEASDSTMPTTDYVYLDDGRPVAVVLPGTGAVYSVLADRLGTPQKAFDANQNLVWSAIYKPFGEAAVTGHLTINLRFPGQYYDAETGFNYNGFRDYVPSLGRYLEVDPIGLRGGMNTYEYLRGNPIAWTDTSGLCNDGDGFFKDFIMPEAVDYGFDKLPEWLKASAFGATFKFERSLYDAVENYRNITNVSSGDKLGTFLSVSSGLAGFARLYNSDALVELPLARIPIPNPVLKLAATGFALEYWAHKHPDEVLDNTIVRYVFTKAGLEY